MKLPEAPPWPFFFPPVRPYKAVLEGGSAYASDCFGAGLTSNWEACILMRYNFNISDRCCALAILMVSSITPNRRSGLGDISN
jgi:hypothetical protein